MISVVSTYMTSFDPLSFASFTPFEMVIGRSRLFTLSLLIDLARAVRPCAAKSQGFIVWKVTG